MLRRYALLLKVLCCWVATLPPEANALDRLTPANRAVARPVEYNREIRPILAEHCFACHGPDKGQRKAGLRLDRKAEATQVLPSGHRAIVPGRPSESRLLQLLRSEDADERMPPRKTGKSLTTAEVDRLEAWIREGAVWQEHWAYVAPERPPLPAVTNVAWARNEVDAFVLERLERAGLAPSVEAAPHTLLRRVTLDLTGLPPTIEEVDAFLADATPNAYEKVIDRLLSTSAYGERMAEHWLDLARYADSDGYHADTARSMWQYRDYVIQSFARHKRFDQFVLEQLAGDLLPHPTLEQRIATAFNRNGMSSTEGGADPDEYMNKYVTDRVNTFGTVFLGSSIACTECHDHKYDPLTQREYYQLYDFFNRIPEKGLDSDPAPPFIRVPSPEQTEAQARLEKTIADLDSERHALLRQTDAASDRTQGEWEQSLRLALREPWQPLTPKEVVTPTGAKHIASDLHTVHVTGPIEQASTYLLTLESPIAEVSALRLEVRPKGAGPTGGEFLLTGLSAEVESANPNAEPPPRELAWGGWSRLGPFKAGSGKEALEKAFIAETNAPDLAFVFPAEPTQWLAAPLWRDDVPQPLWGEGLTTYFHRTVTSPTPRWITLGLGSDGGMRGWINGRALEGGRVLRGTAKEPDRVQVRLEAGSNQLWLKVHHGNGAHGFLFAQPTAPVVRQTVLFRSALAEEEAEGQRIEQVLDNKTETGWTLPKHSAALSGGRPALAIFVCDPPPSFQGGNRWRVQLHFAGAPAGRPSSLELSLSVQGPNDRWTALTAVARPALAALFRSPDSLTDADRAALREQYRGQHWPTLQALHARLATERKALTELQARLPTLRVMEDMKEPRPSEIRVRGDYRHRGERVTAGVPQILPPLPPLSVTNRLALARWLTDPRHPLLSRVTVNRIWALTFGHGLVKTGNEFGTQGEWPSHPELLDWLAREFIDSGWNLQALQKKLVSSATYRQASAVTPAAFARDPENRLLGRGPRERLSAEMIRDCALDYAGLLDRTRAPGGPSVRPYQPAGLWEEKMFGGNSYVESQGADLYRRSVYTLWKRTVLNPTLMTFDAPDRALCTEQRSVTCTPLQAFVTLNEKGFVEAARVLAERILRFGGSTEMSRLHFACKTVWARPPTRNEERILLSLHEDVFRKYQSDLQGALDLISTGAAPRAKELNQLECAAWTAVANALLNLDETLTKE